MNKQETARERRKFEKYCKDLLWEERLGRDSEGNYEEDFIDAMWHGWAAKVESGERSADRPAIALVCSKCGSRVYQSAGWVARDCDGSGRRHYYKRAADRESEA